MVEVEPGKRKGSELSRHLPDLSLHTRMALASPHHVQYLSIVLKRRGHYLPQAPSSTLVSHFCKRLNATLLLLVHLSAHHPPSCKSTAVLEKTEILMLRLNFRPAEFVRSPMIFATSAPELSEALRKLIKLPTVHRFATRMPKQVEPSASDARRPEACTEQTSPMVLGSRIASVEWRQRRSTYMYLGATHAPHVRHLESLVPCNLRVPCQPATASQTA
ncbi:hypothetical protein HDK90DRAFT_293433 [Phyllosticta capitalensis]|uniref:Uncharacterized protein n=1 Tax=Phyllosticta capitalensis TaxID=121624 RepID=A0ABR1YK65_9PEZI